MREHVDPPVNFGGSGGIVWPLGPNAHTQIPETRRPRPDPRAPTALRVTASSVSVRFAECGRRYDPREWVDQPAVRGFQATNMALPGGPLRLESRGKNRGRPPNQSRFHNAPRGDESSSDDASENASSSDSETGSDVDHRLAFETSEAFAALETNDSVPVGIRRTLQRRLREAHGSNSGDWQQRRFGNTLAATPWPSDGLAKHINRPDLKEKHVMVAHTFGEGATQVRISKAILETKQSESLDTNQNNKKATLRVVSDFLLPHRRGKQPILQVECANTSHGWFERFADDAQPALCAMRDPYGVSLCAVGGGVRTVATPGRPKKRKEIDESKFDLSPSPILLWSETVDGISDISLSPHGAPELLVASRDGGLKLMDASVADKEGGAKRMLKDKNQFLKNVEREVCDPVPTHEKTHAFGQIYNNDLTWTGCAYATHPRVALLATARTVRRVDLRTSADANSYRKCLITENIENEKNKWRALCGPPIAEWSPSSFLYGNQSGNNNIDGSSSREYAFALACDAYVSLFDLRKPYVPILRWRHQSIAAPSWIKFENTHPWRGLFGRGSGVIDPEEGSAYNERVTAGGLLLAGFPASSEVLGFEFAQVGNTLDGSIVGGVRALSAGTKMPTESDAKIGGLQGFAMLPPTRRKSGGLLYATRDGAVRYRAHFAPVNATGGDSTAPLAFTDESGGRDGVAVRQETGFEISKSNRVSRIPETDLPEPPNVISPELCSMFGAAAGVVDMPRSQAVFGEKTARAAAEGAKRAAVKTGGNDDANVPTPTAKIPKIKKLPLVSDFINRGVTPFDEIDTRKGRTKSNDTLDETIDTTPDNIPLTVSSIPLTHRASGLLKSIGRWPSTEHELAFASVAARDNSSGGASDVSAWVTSKTSGGSRRSRTVRDRMVRVPKKEEESVADDGGLGNTSHPPAVLRRRGADEPQPIEANVGNLSRLAKVLGDDDDDNLNSTPHTPHASWLRAASRWLDDDAGVSGLTTYDVDAGDDKTSMDKLSHGTQTSTPAAAARETILSRWPIEAPQGTLKPPKPKSKLKTLGTHRGKMSSQDGTTRRVSFAPAKMLTKGRTDGQTDGSHTQQRSRLNTHASDGAPSGSGRSSVTPTPKKKKSDKKRKSVWKAGRLEGF